MQINPEKLFERLINNEITREEFDSLLENIDNDELRTKYDLYLERQFMKELDAHFTKPDNHQETTSKESTVFKKVERNKKSKNYTLAASLSIILALTAFIIYSLVPFSSDMIYEASHHEDLNPIVIKNTPNKRLFRTRLSDGSFVHLNAVSSISYPKEFPDNSRAVEIQGEAYFDVKRDEERPFHVKVKNYTVEVLGTSFDIKAYEDEDHFSVTVESGTVKVDLHKVGEEAITLTQNQKLLFSSESNEISVLEVNPANELSWRKGILKFDATPIIEVEHILERWYGVDIEIEDEAIYEKSLSGVHQNENIKSVIESLTYATGTDYTIEENKIIIKNKSI